MKNHIVIVREAFKSHYSGEDQLNVLNGLNLCVQSGSIFALVGASGCGKTTLLSSIVGQRYLDRGDVFVLGEKLKPRQLPKCCLHIGFMPQETALHDEFTVNEILYFFGNILQMDSDLLHERAEMLKKLLELPSNDQKVQDCSGGQKRRISLAAAMIHDPQLLILDEPTVGLDPILREKIWNYLLDIAHNGNVSVILSTHYIDEAKRADYCGLMRNGTLIAQDSPEMILQNTQCENLEESFLKLCCSSYEMYESSSVEDVEMLESENVDHDVKTRKLFHKNTLKALMYKSYIQVARQPASLFTIFVCLMVLIFFKLSFGKYPQDSKIGIVDEELSEYYENCSQWSSSKIKADNNGNEHCDLQLMSCRFLDEISDDIGVKIFYKNFTEAFQDLKKGKLISIINFSSNFSKSTLRVTENNYDDKDLDEREIKIWMDYTVFVTAYFIEVKLYKIHTKYSKLLMECDLRYYSPVPIRFEKPIYGSLEFNFERIGPIFFLMVCFFSSFILSTTHFVDDRLDKTWNRIILTGLDEFEFIVAHTMVYTIIMLIMLVINIFMMILFHPNLIHVKIAPLIVLFGLTGLSGLLCGIFSGCIINDYKSAGFVGNLMGFLIICLSGIIWPLEFLPKLFTFLPKIIVVTSFASVAIQNIIEKDYGFANYSVIIGIMSLLVWCIIFIICTCGIMKIRKYA